MSVKKCGVVLVLLAVLAGVAAASAGATSLAKKTGNTGITIVSGYDMKQTETADTSGMVYASAVYTIRQGQTNSHPKYIGPGCYGYYIDLNWGNSANSLRLTVVGPDGTPYGPFYDSSDGRMDGRIYLYVSNSGNPMPVGTWGHFVYGYIVYGIEDYTF